MEELRPGKHEISNYHTQGYFPEGRERVPKLLGTYIPGMPGEEQDLHYITIQVFRTTITHTNEPEHNLTCRLSRCEL